MPKRAVRGGFMGKGILRVLCSWESPRNLKSACRNEWPSSCHFWRCLRKGKRRLYRQLGAPESLVSQTRPQPFSRTTGRLSSVAGHLWPSFKHLFSKGCLEDSSQALLDSCLESTSPTARNEERQAQPATVGGRQLNTCCGNPLW